MPGTAVRRPCRVGRVRKRRTAFSAEAGITNVDIVEHEELLGDHYDPRASGWCFLRPIITARRRRRLGVAAHECGHALQHKQAYAPLQLRMAAVGVTGFASQVVMWIPLLGMFTGLLAAKTGLLIMAVAWGILMAFNLITLPVEFDASRRAKAVLGQMGFIQAGSEAGRREPGAERGWMDICGGVRFLAALFPLALAAPVDREEPCTEELSRRWTCPTQLS